MRFSESGNPPHSAPGPHPDNHTYRDLSRVRSSERLYNERASARSANSWFARGPREPGRCRLFCSGICNRLLVCFRFGRCADHLQDVRLGRLQREVQLVAGRPRIHVRLRIIDLHRQFQRVMVHPNVSLLHTQFAAVRVPCIIKPGSLVQPNRLHQKRIIIRPPPYRVSIPPWIRVLGKFSPVRPNDPPDSLILIQHQHLVGSLNDLKWPQFKKQVARESGRIAAVQGIIHPPYKDSPGPVPGLIDVVGYVRPPSRERSMRLHTLRRNPLHRIRHIPNSRQITARGRRRFLTLRRLWLLLWSGLSTHARRKRQCRDYSDELLPEYGLTVRNRLLHNQLLTILN